MEEELTTKYVIVKQTDPYGSEYWNAHFSHSYYNYVNPAVIIQSKVSLEDCETQLKAYVSKQKEVERKRKTDGVVRVLEL